jgi:hypothetical protein
MLEHVTSCKCRRRSAVPSDFTAAIREMTVCVVCFHGPLGHMMPATSSDIWSSILVGGLFGVTNLNSRKFSGTPRWQSASQLGVDCRAEIACWLSRSLALWQLNVTTSSIDSTNLTRGNTRRRPAFEKTNLLCAGRGTLHLVDTKCGEHERTVHLSSVRTIAQQHQPQRPRHCRRHGNEIPLPALSPVDI